MKYLFLLTIVFVSMNAHSLTDNPNAQSKSEVEYVDSKRHSETVKQEEAKNVTGNTVEEKDQQTEMLAQDEPEIANKENNEAKELVREVLDRYVGHTEVSTISLATCEYKIKGGRVACVSSPRKKTVKAVSKYYGENLKDSRGLMIIVEPLAEYGIGILQYDYIESGKDADQWLYLPELDQVKRVASSNDAPKKGSLFGSEFSLEDVEIQKLNDYQYKIIDTENISGRETVVIEQTPTKKKAVKTNYMKRIQWIDRERLTILKEEFYEWNGELLKTNYVSNVKKIDGIWTARKQIMRNFKTDRISMLSYGDVAYNKSIEDEALTQRILSDVVFRKKFLNALENAPTLEVSHNSALD